MRRMTLLFGVALVAAACGGSAGAARPAAGAVPAASPERTEPTLVLNVTASPDDPHAVLMALELAGEALAEGRRTVLFFNVHAVPWVTSTGPSEQGFHGSPPFQQILRERMAEGATVLVCPHCMEVVGVTEGELLPGAQLASRSELFAALGPDTTVFTY